jgi:hypothetical protein
MQAGVFEQKVGGLDAYKKSEIYAETTSYAHVPRS